MRSASCRKGWGLGGETYRTGKSGFRLGGQQNCRPWTEGARSMEIFEKTCSFNQQNPTTKWFSLPKWTPRDSDERWKNRVTKDNHFRAMDIQDSIWWIFYCRTMLLFRATSSITSATLDAHSIFTPFPQWIDTWRSRFEQKTNSMPIDPRDENHKDPEYIDFSVPRRAPYVHNAWKKHQDAVFWVDINLAIREGLTFHHARSNAIVLQGTLPASCILKVVRLKTGEGLYEKSFMSLRRPPKISSRHDHDWTSGNHEWLYSWTTTSRQVRPTVSVEEFNAQHSAKQPNQNPNQSVIDRGNLRTQKTCLLMKVKRPVPRDRWKRFARRTQFFRWIGETWEIVWKPSQSGTDWLQTSSVYLAAIERRISKKPKMDTKVEEHGGLLIPAKIIMKTCPMQIDQRNLIIQKLGHFFKQDGKHDDVNTNDDVEKWTTQHINECMTLHIVHLH